MIDSLISTTGIIPLEYTTNADTPNKEERGLTIKSTAISLHFEMPTGTSLPPGSDGNSFLINLIDSPGHVDLSSEVTAALRVTDGVLFVVDAVEGFYTQPPILQQALNERIIPILSITKVDRSFLELQMEPEDMYQSFVRIIERTNVTLSTYQDKVIGDVCVYPQKGTVAFASGLQGWAFTLSKFAHIYAKKFGVDPTKMTQRLWGDNYFDVEGKKWVTSGQSSSGKSLSRSFCKFILEPIYLMFRVCMDMDMDKVNKCLTAIGVTLTSEEQTLKQKKLLKVVMQKWLPAEEALLEMTVHHIPSPVTSQKYRVQHLYTGPMNDETAISIRDCNSKGPLVMYVSKMVRVPDKDRFFAFGRVFSGTVTVGHQVRILGANYEFGKKEDLYIKNIQSVVISMGRRTEPVDSVPCGNICALVGIDHFLTKSGTIVSEEHSHPLVTMKFSVSPVVRVAVEPKNPSDLPKLVEGLKRLSQSDPLVLCTVEESGEHIIAGAGELHLEVCIKDLQEYMRGTPVIVSEPIVSFRETVTQESSIMAFSKSPNKHNRLHAKAVPIHEELSNAIERGDISPKDDPKVRARRLAEEYNWDITEARNIWAFGPNSNGANLLVDVTKGVQYLNEIKDSVVLAFQWVTREGVLAQENLRGIRFNILDVVLHADAIHRGSGAMIPTARRVFYAAQLTAQPRLMEPVYLVEIVCPQTVVEGVYFVLNKRRGQVIEEIQLAGTPLTNVKAYLPVMESFGLTAELRSNTEGQAFPQSVFDHWKVMQGDPTEAGNKANEIIIATRKRKGLGEELPSLDRFHDK